MKETVIQKLPLVLFCLYFIKVMFFPVSYAEVGILLILGAVSSYFEFKNQDKRLEEMKSHLDQAIKSFESKTKEIEEMKNAFNAMKLSAITRTGNGSR